MHAQLLLASPCCRIKLIDGAAVSYAIIPLHADRAANQLGSACCWLLALGLLLGRLAAQLGLGGLLEAALLPPFPAIDGCATTCGCHRRCPCCPGLDCFGLLHWPPAALAHCLAALPRRRKWRCLPRLPGCLAARSMLKHPSSMSLLHQAGCCYTAALRNGPAEWFIAAPSLAMQQAQLLQRIPGQPASTVTPRMPCVQTCASSCGRIAYDLRLQV